MIQINPRSSVPIFQQIVDNYKENIVRGLLKAGDRIPSIREMALTLETNPNTVSKAYKELENEKIIETLQGKGTFIVENLSIKQTEEKLNIISNILKNIIIEAKFMGISKDEFNNLVTKIYDEFGGL